MNKPIVGAIVLTAMLFFVVGLFLFANLSVTPKKQILEPTPQIAPKRIEPQKATKQAVASTQTTIEPPRAIELAAFLSRDNKLGVEVTVIGRVRELGIVKLYQANFWEVKHGVGYAALGDGGEQPQMICILRASCSEMVLIGNRHVVNGIYRGAIATSGVPILIDCVIESEPQ